MKVNEIQPDWDSTVCDSDWPNSALATTDETSESEEELRRRRRGKYAGNYMEGVGTRYIMAYTRESRTNDLQ